MPYYTNAEERERNERVAELKRKLEKLTIDLAIAQAQLDYVQEKLKEAQERNRKMDWLLAEAMEGKL